MQSVRRPLQSATRLLWVLCLLHFVTGIAPSAAQDNGAVRAQMAEAIRALRQEIASLDKQLKAARLAKEDPATIKQLEEQLALLKRQVGMMEGVGQQVSRVPNEMLTQAAGEATGKAALPKRDAKRIAAVPDRTLTETELASFVRTVQAEVERLLPKEKAEALRIHAALKAEKRSPDYIASVATSLWLAGYTDLAVLLQGRESAADPANVNNLNNYAAFLSMGGGEHAAVPILQNLDSRFPGNSTILNNLGQAWYGLGETSRAEQLLKQAIAAYPRHAQANLTMSVIQEAQGKTAEAIQSVKQAIAEHWTGDKEQRVTDLGGSVRFEDIPFPWPRPRGPWPPLGVEKFWNAIPPYPSTAEDADRNAAHWRAFREELGAVGTQVQLELDQAFARYEPIQMQIVADPRRLLPYNNPVHNTAVHKRNLLAQWTVDRLLQLHQRSLEIGQQVDGWRREMDVVLTNPNATCGARANAAVRFMQQANGVYRDQNARMVDYLQQYTSAMVPLDMYAANDSTEYEWRLAGLKREVLGYLGGLPFAWAPVCSSPRREPGLRQPLPDFDEATCAYRDQVYIPPFTTIVIECNRMTTDFDVSDLGLKVKLGWSENLNTGALTRGTLELGAGIDLVKAGAGPFSAEVKGSGAVGVEVTPDGIKEVYVKASVKAEVESDMAQGMSVEAGKLEVKSSWNAGPSGSPARPASAGPAPLSAIRWSGR